MQGKIIKGIAGFYYVDTHQGVFTCKAKGKFRSDNFKPLIGDDALIEIISEEKLEGNISRILPRKNELIRPATANVDQALVVFAAAKPEPNFNLLDRFLVMMQKQQIETIICFNKSDIVTDKELKLLEETYRKCGHRLIFISVLEQEGIDTVRSLLKGKTTVFAGPSGVGKSSLTNLLAPDANMETGELSVKIDRGKQTTRHTQLIRMDEDTYICDTPGFSSLFVADMSKEELRDFFVEFQSYGQECRFLSCSHINEPDCRVKSAVSEGLISRIRYDNYVLMYEELSAKKNNSRKAR